VALFDEHPLSDLDKKAHDILGDKVVVKSLAQQAAFQGLPRVKQHQLVYAALKGKMGGELHALALETSAPA